MPDGSGIGSAGLNTAFSLHDTPQFSLEVNEAMLKEDDDLLRQIFTQVFRHHHPELANKVDVIFTLAQVRSNPCAIGPAVRTLPERQQHRR